MTTYQPYGGYNNDFNNDFNSGGFDNNNNGTNLGSSQQRTQTRSSLTPVTIKMLNESTPQVQDGEFIVHNIELNLVSFCGIVRNITDNTSNLVVQLEDGTGAIEIRAWINDSSPDEHKDLEVGKYFFVTGSLKDFQGKKNVQHATFTKIDDFNQVVYHQLSAIDVYLRANGKLGGDGGASKQKEALFVGDDDNKVTGSNLSISDRILECITEHTPSMPEGVPVAFIAQTLNMLVDDVHLYCGKLTEDAKIFVGYDENGYLAV